MVQYHELKNGDYVIGSINRIKIVGRVLIPEHTNYAYFIQNVIKGAELSMDKLSDEDKKIRETCSHSWVFGKGNDFSGKPFSHGVAIDKIVTEEEAITAGLVLEPFQVFIDGEGRMVLHYTNKQDIIELFDIMKHPDCCGAKLLYGFCSSETISYSRYNPIKKEVYPVIKKILMEDNKACIAHIASYQEGAHALLEDLGFEVVTTYDNPNSGNEITVYHLTKEDLDENTES